jgi:3-deoxy-D-manno-octulosonic acid (KDO) 8-phosphate synthase
LTHVEGNRNAAELGLPVITEVVDPSQVNMVSKYADILQVGVRNMQNFALLTKIGKSKRPVVLKRGLVGSKPVVMPLVTPNIQTGPASPTQKAAWRKFWQRLIAEVKAGEH